MKIYIAADHAGYEFKETIKEFLVGMGHDVADKGAFTFDKDDDYPDFITPCAQAVADDEGSFGIVLGGSGQGEAMAANRISGVRCALFYGGVLAKEAVDINGRMSDDPYEIVRMTRLHNNANMLSLSGRFTTEDEAKKAITIWLETPFHGEERHVRRTSKF
jgi:ribose 5-phosphate isomerase B